MAKYKFNEHWRARDRAYDELNEALLERLSAVIAAISERLCPRRKGPGRPPKIGAKEAAFLAVAKEHHHQMPYRELASSRYVKWLGIAGVHYTSDSKGDYRLPKRLLDGAMRTCEFLSAVRRRAATAGRRRSVRALFRRYSRGEALKISGIKKFVNWRRRMLSDDPPPECIDCSNSIW